MSVVTRFAPSPTGYLHVGGARTALFSWLLARHHGGRFLLRIEDTDLARSTPTAVATLLDDLTWLGLHWDNSELVYQSKRLHIYNALIDRLIAQGRAYKAYDTPEELQARREQAEREKRVFLYRRQELTEAQIRNYEAQGRPHVVRFAMPVREWRFDDVVLGPNQGVAADQVQDFVIRKSDGMPTYHFAVVVDDAEMGITHVLRGQEHLLNTVNHIALQEALGYPRPVYAHLPVILNIDGSKMGKRDRDRKIRQQTQNFLKNTRKTLSELAKACGLSEQRLVDWLRNSSLQLDLPEQQALMPHIGLCETDLPEILVHDFRKNGYLPEALINFLALLGWNPKDDQEHLTIQELCERFGIEGINKANAKFDRAKLLSFNTETAARLPVDRLVQAMRAYLQVNPDSPCNQATDAQLATLLEMKKGFRTLREVDEACRFAFLPDDQIVYEPASVEKVLKKNNGEGLSVLGDLQRILPTVLEWTAHALEQAVQSYCQDKSLGLGKVAQPLRLAVTGTTISPPIFQSLEFLGQERTLVRIARCLSLVA